MQRAYKDKYDKLPLEDGVDVISVGSLAFERFLEIAEILELNVRVITDNDADVAALKTKYEKYLNEVSHPSIKICYSDNEALPTLEPQILSANSLNGINAILGTKHTNEIALLNFMRRNKTNCALKLFETNQKWVIPGYIADALK